MRNLWIVAPLLISFSLSAESRSQDIRYQNGHLRKISCSFRSGISRTPSSAPLKDVNFPDSDQVVCDPLSNTASASPEKGLVAKLIVKSPEMPAKTSSVMEFYNQGQRLPQKLYFADVNVPTRPFTSGFQNQNGETLVDANGEKLIENFALEYDSILKLAEGDKEGYYELSSLSDDGARVFIKENDKWVEIINNDGTHSTRLGCPYRTVELKKESEIPLKILYYQGPRYHVANVLLWKHHKSPKTWRKPSSHALCGVAGNDFFYNNKSDKKTLAMKYLEATGWRVVAADNFKMPAQTSNPCAEVDLSLSEFVVASAQAPNATLTWKTNLPASSQIRVLNIYTGEEYLTPEDSSLVTEHSAQLSGLVRGIYYQVQAISKDEKGRVVTSPLINLLP